MSVQPAPQVFISHGVLFDGVELPEDAAVMHVWLQEPEMKIVHDIKFEPNQLLLCVAYGSIEPAPQVVPQLRRRRVHVVTGGNVSPLPDPSAWEYMGTAIGGKYNAACFHVFAEILPKVVRTITVDTM
jgi:hypothetical protein